MRTIPETNIVVPSMCSIREYGAADSLFNIVKLAHGLKVIPAKLIEPIF